MKSLRDKMVEHETARKSKKRGKGKKPVSQSTKGNASPFAGSGKPGGEY